MRTFLATHWKAIVALIILVLLAVFVVPTGSASPALAARLHARADAVAGHTAGAAGLDGALRYIAATLAAQGYRVHVQRDVTGGPVMRKVEAWRSGARPGQPPVRSFILAARYGSAGQDELAATASMLELARLLKAVRPAVGTEIRFVFFVSRAVPADAPFGSFVAYAGPRGALEHVSEALAFFRNAPEGAPGALAAPAWVQGVTLGHLPGGAGAGDGAMLLADIGALHSPCLPASGDTEQPDYKGVARMLQQLAQSIRVLAGVTES
ncbi:MAG: hypothetical protein ACXWC4_09235 [Telluria sp.]